MAVDGQRNVYIVDLGNSRVRKVSPGGIITTVAGGPCRGPVVCAQGDGGPATEAWLSSPFGVAVDPHGNLDIGEYTGHWVRKVSAGGTITTLAGNGKAGFSGDGGAATSAQLYAPAGVAVDGQGNVYIADQQNVRVRKVSAGGKITTFAGTGVNGFAGEGRRATSAQMSGAFGVAVDGKRQVSTSRTPALLAF